MLFAGVSVRGLKRGQKFSCRQTFVEYVSKNLEVKDEELGKLGVGEKRRSKIQGGNESRVN